MGTKENSLTILIVDDKEANIFALEKLLENNGRTILKATSGREALKISLEKEIDLLILDVQMPEMDGFEVAQILKTNKKTEDIPIIFATAIKKERRSLMKGFEEGAVDYLFKPLDPDVTKAKVSVFLKIQEQKKELLRKNHSLEKAEKQIKQLNFDLQKNLEQLEAMNKELESFSYMVSHDLRAPLRAVDGYSQMIVEEHINELGEEATRLFNTIRYNAEKMGRLIDDLLDFSRIGKKELRKTELNMEELVEAVIREIGQLNKLKPDIKIKSLLPLYADCGLMYQVFMNLISNAVKYSGKKEHPEIEIDSRMEKGQVIYSIKDNGVGFDMKYAHKLFGVFQRLHNDDVFKGTGIGLAIVQRIITKHGGSVWADAKTNEGAIFYISIPQKPAKKQFI